MPCNPGRSGLLSAVPRLVAAMWWDRTWIRSCWQLYEELEVADDLEDSMTALFSPALSAISVINTALATTTIDSVVSKRSIGVAPKTKDRRCHHWPVGVRREERLARPRGRRKRPRMQAAKTWKNNKMQSPHVDWLQYCSSTINLINLFLGRFSS